jgi:hypothetical protein
VDGFGQGQRRHIGDDHEMILLSEVYSEVVFYSRYFELGITKNFAIAAYFLLE